MKWQPKSYVRSVAGSYVTVYTKNKGEWFWRLWAHTRPNTRHGPFPTLSRALADAADSLSAVR
jgi:hypothetical protein